MLVANGFRQKLDSARWVLALSASLSQLLAVIVATARQGQRFTHWTLSQHLSSPLFHFGPIYFNADILLDLLVFLSIIYTVYHYIRDQQDRKAILEQELHSARELAASPHPRKATHSAGVQHLQHLSARAGSGRRLLPDHSA